MYKPYNIILISKTSHITIIYYTPQIREEHNQVFVLKTAEILCHLEGGGGRGEGEGGLSLNLHTEINK